MLGHIVRCGPQAPALYLLLVTVADAQSSFATGNLKRFGF